MNLALKEQPVHLWLDDKRPYPAGWHHAKTAREAIDVLKTKDVGRLSLDHDLGHCASCTECKGYGSRCGCECHWTGMTVVIFMINTGIWPTIKPTVHSQNPVGAGNMNNAIERYWGRGLGITIPEGPEQGFRLTFAEQARCESFQAKHRGHHKESLFSYTFSPNGIGTGVDISCSSCKEVLDVTDYASW